MIRLILLASIVFLTPFGAISQKLSGQWTGGFTSSGNSFSGKTDYVLELEIKDNNVSGYSYTYFNLGSKRCFTICRLSGNFDKGSKSLIVKEVEKVKGNTPPDFQDCLQTHSLTYLKAEGKEILAGKWKPAFEKNNCGTGETELERKQLVRVLPQTNKTEPVTKGNNLVKNQLKQPPVTKQPPKPATPKEKPVREEPDAITAKPLSEPSRTIPLESNATPKNYSSREQQSIADKPKLQKINDTDQRIVKRNKQVIKTINVDEKSIRVDLYDNGQIDGDTVSLYLNGKLMVSKQRLSTSPISLNIDLSDVEEQELIMYAENLGTIPPNTALMVVTSGEKRYEVNITSSEQFNGAVRFVKKSQW